MTIQFKPLIAAIDAQNLDQVETFITQNPDLDYNCVTPGGLSALWIALYPPKGKPISTELLRFLLQYIKPNGASLVNPTQSLHRWRPIDSIDTLEESQYGKRIQ